MVVSPVNRPRGDHSGRDIEDLSAVSDLVGVDLGSPYLVRDATGVDTICVYGAGDAEQEAALDVLQGVTQATGRIPSGTSARADSEVQWSTDTSVCATAFAPGVGNPGPASIPH